MKSPSRPGLPFHGLADDTLLRRLRHIHFGPLTAVLGLAVIGLLTVSSASSDQAENFLPRQIIWVLVGVVALAIVLFAFDYHALVQGAPLLYGLGLAALVLVLFVGRVAGGARSWLTLGPFTVQPSELQKIATVLLLVWYLSRREASFLNLREILTATLLAAVPIALIAAERDLGTAAMYVPMLGALLLTAGIRTRQLVAIALISVVMAAGAWSFVLKPYQRQRVTSFLSPEEDPLGAGYQVRQSKIAVGSGGLSGRGWGQGTQSQLRFLPERHSDFAMAVLAEEWGFLGVTIVLALYGLYLFSAAQIALRSRDRSGVLLVVGLATIFAAHVVYNTAMVVGLLPITGIPLPFLSYGGSFMLFNCLATGLILNVDHRRFVNR